MKSDVVLHMCMPLVDSKFLLYFFPRVPTPLDGKVMDKLKIEINIVPN